VYDGRLERDFGKRHLGKKKLLKKFPLPQTPSPSKLFNILNNEKGHNPFCKPYS